MDKVSTLNMPNNYFQFKQFRITQGKSAMKVTTEGAVFGALINHNNPKKILDIGTGTGILSLMLAQRFQEAEIDALEIDEHAASDAKKNFNDSSWANRLNVFHTDARKLESDKKYDLMVSNPPFFNNSLKSKRVDKNRAIHDDSLSQQDLLKIFEALLTEKGSFAVMYPHHEAMEFSTISTKNGFYLKEHIDFYDHPNAKILRSVLIFSKQKSESKKWSLILKKEKGGDYTEKFIELLKPYYLYL